MQILNFKKLEAKSPKELENLVRIVKSKSAPFVLTTSEFAGVKTLIQRAVSCATTKNTEYLQIFGEIEQLHFGIIDQLISYKNQTEIKAKVKILLNSIEELLQGVYFIEATMPAVESKLQDCANQMSAMVVAAVLEESAVAVEVVESSRFLKVNKQHGKSLDLDTQETEKAMQKLLGAKNTNYVLSTVAGLDQAGKLHAVGDGAADACACIAARALGADQVEMWVGQDGIPSADPAMVEQAFTIPQMSYEEAMELSYMGNAAFDPYAIHPVVDAKIPLFIKDKRQPEKQGTKLSAANDEAHQASIKGLSSMSDVALVTLSGAGLHGMPYISKRLFTALSQAGVNVLFISQASSEHSICVGVKEFQSQQAVKRVNREFAAEIASKSIEPVKSEENIAIVSIVGNGMAQHVGTSGQAFTALGENGINVVAIAQGASERNLSFALKNSSLKKALNVMHESFFLSDTKKIHLFFAGVGNVGQELLNQIYQQGSFLKEQHHLELVPVLFANSKKYYECQSTTDLLNASERIAENGVAYSFPELLEKMKTLNLRNAVFVDNTASDYVAGFYDQILQASISVIASNKVAAAAEMNSYLNIKKIAKSKKAKYLYETNVAAGLPIIRTLQDLVHSGDRILKIEAVLSGSLNFIFNNLAADCPFSEVVAQAREQGYTEPDARIDLSGVDVMRKILILAREAGASMNIEQVQMTKFLPERCFESGEWEKLYPQLQTQNEQMEQTRLKAEQAGEKLRVLAKYENGKAQVRLTAVGASSPAYTLDGSDNIVLITTERYKDFPLVVKGAGAGAQVTAMGVFADIMRFAHQ